MKNLFKKIQSKKLLDVFVLIAFPIISTYVSFLIEANYLISTLLFFGLPALWFSFRIPNKILKITLFSIFLTIPFIIVVDYIGTQDQSWVVPTTVFPFLLFGLTPVENFFQGFFVIFSVVMYYEYFFEKRTDKLIVSRMKYFGIIFAPIIIIFLILLWLYPEILYIKYAYLVLGSIFILLPVLIARLFVPELFKKIYAVSLYFFPVIFLSEIVGVRLNQWAFPSKHYIGWFSFFNTRFPIEELVFWCMLVSVGILVYYEFFDDDMK